jgi:hypothetical protein
MFCSYLFASAALGGPRPFTLVEDAYPEGKGIWELENTFAYDHRTHHDNGFNAFSMEHEIEYGIAENVDLKVPISYSYTSSSDEGDHFRFGDIGFEPVIYFSSPSTDPIGVSLQTEVAVGESTLSFATLLVLQKDIGDWVIAYNIGQETEIEGVFRNNGESETSGTIINAFGATYNITRDLRIGGEISAESSYGNWNHYDGTAIHAGPVLNYFAGQHFWFTLGPHFLIGQHDDEPKFEVTAILGYTF